MASSSNDNGLLRSIATSADGRLHRATNIGELLGGARTVNQRGRTFAPVRRNSYYANDKRSNVWRPIAGSNRDARRLIAARLKAAEFYDRRGKEAGKKNGPLGHVGLEVLRELYRIVDFKTGRLEPAIDTVCNALRRSRAAVVAAMRRLREHGFLNWVRRTEPTECQGAGPQVRQITNAYFFDLPARAAAWVKRTLGDGPPPDCEVARAEADKSELDAMIGTLSLGEQGSLLGGSDDQLSEMLRKLGEALEKKSASSLNGQNPASEE
jgi:hypothetical protein